MQFEKHYCQFRLSFNFVFSTEDMTIFWDNILIATTTFHVL